MTQEEVDRLIDKYIAHALKQEEKRDRAVYESQAYWIHHDTAVYWHKRAEALMSQ